MNQANTFRKLTPPGASRPPNAKDLGFYPCKKRGMEGVRYLDDASKVERDIHGRHHHRSWHNLPGISPGSSPTSNTQVDNISNVRMPTKINTGKVRHTRRGEVAKLQLWSGKLKSRPTHHSQYPGPASCMLLVAETAQIHHRRPASLLGPPRASRAT
jgi:hypothetical protein